jgi:predicted PurR-regulated permease PerM
MENDRYQRLIVLMLGLLTVFIAGVVLYQLRSILLPFVIAVLLSNIFEPVVVALKRRGVPTAISLLVVLLTFALVLFLVALVVYSSIDTLTQQLPVYEARLRSLIGQAVSSLSGLAVVLNIDVKELDWSSAVQFSSLTSALTSGVGSFINMLTNLFLILLFMLFILAGSGELEGKIRAAFHPRRATQITTVLKSINERVRQYLVTKTVISTATALVALVILLLLGIDFPFVWAVLTFLLNFVPNIGSIIAVLLPFLLSLLQFGFGGTSLLLLLLLGSTQMIIGNVIEPRLMAFRLNLSTLFVLVSLIFWGWLWGVWGMILAIPIMASIKIVFEQIEWLRPYAILMGRHIRREPSG